MHARARWLVSILLTFILRAALPAGAQDASLPIAAITDGNVWLYGVAGESRRLTNVMPGEPILDLAWSPDGSALAFTGRKANGAISLFLWNARGGPVVELTQGLHPALPAGFTTDSRELIYAAAVEGGGSASGDLVQVYRYTPTAGSAPAPIGAFTLTTRCSPESAPPLPTAARYGFETGSGQFPRAVLAMMPFGLLHSATCLTPDLWHMNPQNGNDRQMFAAVDGVFVSPEQARAVVVADGTVTFVNTELGPYLQLAPAAEPDQVGFGLPDSNEIFYSTREVVAPEPLPAAAADALGAVYFQMPMRYRVSLRRFSLRSGRDDVLYTADAFAIGRIALAPDGDTLIFSQIPNAGAWVEAVASGAALPDDFAAAERIVQTEVYALSLSDGSVRLLGANWNRFALNPAQSP